MKSAIYFILKALFVLKIFKFLSWLFFIMQENGLIRKLSLISKFMTSQTGQHIITIHILPNISRSKDNQPIKFGQLIEYNMRNNFSEIEHISGSTVWNVVKFVFILFPSRSLPKYTTTNVPTTWFCLAQSFLKKTKRGLELVSLPLCLYDFWRKH